MAGKDGRSGHREADGEIHRWEGADGRGSPRENTCQPGPSETAFSHEEIYSDFHHLGKWGNTAFKYKCSV